MKYVAYHRVSTKRQGESGLGIQGQQAIIRHFVRDGEIIAEFTEVASGDSMLKRPKLREAIDLVKKENATLVVAKADRLSRNALDALTLYDEIEKIMYLSRLKLTPFRCCKLHFVQEVGYLFICPPLPPKLLS